MSSPSADIATDGRRGAGVSALLDSAFGFLAWAAHFLIVYISTAVSCVLGLGAAGTHMQTSVLASLAVLTILACIILASHAMRRHSQLRDNPEQEFRLAVTIGCDAIAIFAIAGQIPAIMLVPLCV